MSTTLDSVLDSLADLVAERVAQRLSTDLRAPTSEPTLKLPDFYSESDLAARSGLSPRTLQGWRLKGGGPQWVRCGRRVLYPRASADQFLRGSRTS